MACPTSLVVAKPRVSSEEPEVMKASSSEPAPSAQNIAVPASSTMLSHTTGSRSRATGAKWASRASWRS
jgi:hypothetical protein